MDRAISSHLLSWKKSHRTPLLIRGARQVGKSYSVERFGKKEFFLKVYRSGIVGT